METELIDFIAQFRQRLAALGEPHNAAERYVFHTMDIYLEKAEASRTAKEVHGPGSFDWNQHFSDEYAATNYVHGMLTAAEAYRRDGKIP